MDTFLALVGMFVSVVLIGIILLQRGRGGGLVGALSGLGGQSAFGTKAGDTFTKITIGIAAVWVLLAGIHGHVLRAKPENEKSGKLPNAVEVPSKAPSVSSTKSEDSKAGPGLGSSTSGDADDVGKDEDTKKKSKTIPDASEDKKEDTKKSEADEKPTESKTDSKDEAKPKEDAKPKDETKKDDESK